MSGQSCTTCGCNPCACPGQTALANSRLVDPVITGGTWTGGTFDGPTINGGTTNGQQITGATIDCTTQACSRPPGTCDGTLATTSFVCQGIGDAISPLNPDFCSSVSICVQAGTFGCNLVSNCINSTPGIIQNPAAFNSSTYATISQFGPVRYGAIAEVQNAVCSVALDPCTLGQFWSAGAPNALWTAFAGAVNAVLATAPGFCARVDSCLPASASLCAAVTACGFAPLASPALTGTPTAPTAAPGTNTTQIATTAFVAVGVAAAISGGNPAFCTAVQACIAAGTTGLRATGGVNYAAGSYTGVAFQTGCTALTAGASFTVTFSAPMPNTSYVVNLSIERDPLALPPPLTLGSKTNIGFSVPFPLGTPVGGAVTFSVHRG